MKLDHKKIELKMAERRMTCADIADLAGVSRAAVSLTLRRVKNGAETQPALVGRLALALGCTATELLAETVESA